VLGHAVGWVYHSAPPVLSVNCQLSAVPQTPPPQPPVLTSSLKEVPPEVIRIRGAPPPGLPGVCVAWLPKDRYEGKVTVNQSR